MGKWKKIFIGVTFVVMPWMIFASENKKIVNIQHWQLKNGANVFFVRAPELPVVDINVVFAAGSAYDQQQWGLAALTNNMMSEGTVNANANQIADSFADVGAQFAVDSDRDMAQVSLRSLTDPKYLGLALKTFADVLAQANFPESSFQRVKSQTISAIKMTEQDPTEIANKVFYETVFANQPYAHPVIGVEKTIDVITQQQVQQFYNTYYVGKNANVIIVGDLSLEKAQQVAEQVAGQLKDGQKASPLSLVPRVNQKISRYTMYPSLQTTIVLGQIGIDRNNPDYFPLIVGNYILGGAPLNSLLFKQVRDDRGLAYYAYSYFNPLRYRGPFNIVLKTKAASTQEALSVVQHVLEQFIKTGPEAAALQLAKQNLINSFPLSIATNKSVLDAVTTIVFYQRPLDYLDTYRAKVNAVTVEQVKQAFKKTVDPEKMAVVTVGPR